MIAWVAYESGPVYRSMETGADGRPVVGSQRDQLGVRVAPTQPADVVPIAGQVGPTGDGLSVVPTHMHHLKLLPKRVRPRLFDGESALPIFALQAATLTGTQLQVALVRDTKGVIHARATCVIDTFQAALAMTRDNWRQAWP